MSSHFTVPKPRNRGREKSEICSAWSKMNRITAHSDASHLLFCGCWVTPLTSVYSKGFLFSSATAGTALCKTGALNKSCRNEQTLTTYLPLLSTSPLPPSPALPVTSQSSLHQRVGSIPVHPEGATLLHLFPNYLEHKARYINWVVVPIRYNRHQPRPSSPLTSIPDKICMEIERHLCATFLASIRY